MSAIDRIRHFKPPGPVAASYLADRTSKVKTIRGPVGSGKTVSSIFDGLLAAANVMPISKDGKIHFRDAVIGLTYGQLERNLYPSWHYWLPPDGGNWTPGVWEGGGGRFAKHKINFNVIRNGRLVEVCYEAIFSAIGEVSLEQFVRGFEPSAWYLFEVDQLPEGIIENTTGRLGRYPNADMLPDGATWKGYVRGCLNAPDIDTWYYKLAEEVRPKGFTPYVQPSGLSPHAENLRNLNNPAYYEDLAEQNKHKPRWVKRFIKNEYGPSQDGVPVFPEYSDDFFLAPDVVKAVRGIPLELGVDGGLGNPAAIIGQPMPNGQFRRLSEVIPGRMSVRRFADCIKRDVVEIAELSGIASLELSQGWGDPAGFNGADAEDGELSWMLELAHELGIPILPASDSNAINQRLDAVRDEMVIEGGVPRTWISRRCKVLRKAYASHYCYRVDKRLGVPVAAAKPDKSTIYCHIADADQYWLLGKKGGYGANLVATGPGEQRRLPRGEAAGETVLLQSNFISRS